MLSVQGLLFGGLSSVQIVLLAGEFVLGLVLGDPAGARFPGDRIAICKVLCPSTSAITLRGILLLSI